MHSSEKDRLLNDVLDDPNYQAFRHELEALGRAELRRRSRFRVPVRLALAAMIFAGAILLPWNSGSRPKAEGARSEVPTLAHTGPTVRTAPLPPESTVRSIMDLGLLVRTPVVGPRGLTIVRTDPLDKIPSLTDAQLLACFPDQPVGFVASENSRTLVFFLHPGQSPGEVR